MAFLGFWFCYQTSGKAILASPNKLEGVARAYATQAEAIGIVLMTLGLLVSVITSGFGSGIFTYLMILTCVSSLVIILAPLGVINLSRATVLSTVSLLIEMLYYAGK